MVVIDGVNIIGPYFIQTYLQLHFLIQQLINKLF